MEPTLKTVKKLYSLSGNRCAFPDCEQEFHNPNYDANLSEIAHIEDKKPKKNKKSRYNPNMTEEAREKYDNLILLCPTHHKLVDDEIEMYPVDELKRMKRRHERYVRRVKSGTLVADHPSFLLDVINLLSQALPHDSDTPQKLVAPSPDEKIRFNSVKRYKWIIEEYRVHIGELNQIYEQIEEGGSYKKNFLLMSIRNMYLREKGKYSSLEDIKKNADEILESIEDNLVDRIGDMQAAEEIRSEILELGVSIIMVDAFMRCDILEEPENDSR